MDRREYQRGYYKKKKESGGYFTETRHAYYEAHKEQYKARDKRWHSISNNKLKKRVIPMSPEQFWELKEKQNFLCAIGGEPLPINDKDIHIDHDHETGRIRGATCRGHNVGLGMFGDNFETLEKAAQYIIKHKIEFLNQEWRTHNDTK